VGVVRSPAARDVDVSLCKRIFSDLERALLEDMGNILSRKGASNT
jgi:hypothetical protein